MNSARVDEHSEEALQIRYRVYTEWLTTLLMVTIVGLPFFLGATFAVTFSWILWLSGLILLLVSGMVKTLRSARGLTLDADGIAWHGAELFIPWSHVTSLDVDTNEKGTGKYHLVVRTAEPTEALRGQRGVTRMGIQGHIQGYGGPIAIKAHLLAVPAESVIAVADRLRQASAASGDQTRPDDYARQARRARARKVANFWAAAGFTGFVIELATLALP